MTASATAALRGVVWVQVSARERELDSLRSDLQSLTTTLESSAAHEREDIRREQVCATGSATRLCVCILVLHIEWWTFAWYCHPMVPH